MSVLVLDCCSLVHAKAMGKLRFTPLSMIHDLGSPHTTTPRVRGELGQSSLESTLAAWQAEGRLTLERASRHEVRTLRNQLRRGDREPGDHDKELVALALRRNLPLLTHDGPAATLARRAGVTVVDLADVAGLAINAGIVSLPEVDADWGDLRDLPWPWPDYPWQGSLSATLHARGWNQQS